ncbi:ATP-grasp peptide maturase system methyltransferase [Embleya scabrispora]|uniref:ATP-grasp peptide maturase system methyltransferase n=1 Tax=Embleya scabrispora TaxID=159449 RepID=UPI0003679496
MTVKTSTDPEETRAVRARLADELEAAGELTDPAWRTAVEKVPREAFVPGFYRSAGFVDGATRWEPVTAASDPAAWLDAVYSDTTLITQLDGKATDWADPKPRVGGHFTSSSTLPSLVVRMWEDADIHDGHSLLEVGTGTGYSTALACERLGSDLVTSVDVDGSVLDRAVDALNRLGYMPWVATADGLQGYWPGAPYDRIVAACSVRCIPDTWLRQTTPGGRILTTLGGWGDGYARVLLTVDGDRAHGHLLPGTVSFMPARRDATPAPGNPYHWAMTAKEDEDTTTRDTILSPVFYREATVSAFHARFVAQLAAPTAQMVDPAGYPEGSVFLVDTASGSSAAIGPDGDGWTVTQSGPDRLWDRIEDAVMKWRAAGSFAMTEFEMTVHADEQLIRHAATGLRFVLPHL